MKKVMGEVGVYLINVKIFVKVKTNSRENKVVPPKERLFGTEETKDFYVVCVKEPPREGRANEAVVRELADYFGSTKSEVKLVSGATSKTKVFKIGI